MKKIILFIFIIIFINYNIEVLHANTEKLARVLINTVKKEFISESYIVTSRVAAFKSDTISVKSPGPVEDVYVEVGDFVKIASLNSTDFWTVVEAQGVWAKES